MDIVQELKDIMLKVYDLIPNGVKVIVGNALSACVYVLIFTFLSSVVDGMAISAALTFALRAAIKVFLSKINVPDQVTTESKKGSKKAESSSRLPLKELVV